MAMWLKYNVSLQKGELEEEIEKEKSNKVTEGVNHLNHSCMHDLKP
jgi:hypothetical protein